MLVVPLSFSDPFKEAFCSLLAFKIAHFSALELFLGSVLTAACEAMHNLVTPN